MADRAIVLDFEKPLVELERRIAQMGTLARDNQVDVTDQLQQLEQRADQLRQEIFGGLTPSQRIQIARHPRRPSTLDYIQAMTDEWLELHGDRCSSDDPALVGGLARIEEQAMVILGHQKGRDTKDNVLRNFGMASPGGYRKALRLMEHADRFGLPIVTLIDTPGAYPGVSAEEQGQGEAIAVNLREMFHFESPILCTVIGEGGSGGALGLGIGDHLIMLEYAVYTVATPEACAAILWRDSSKAPRAAEALKITAKDLKGLGVIDQIVKEPPGAAHRNPLAAAATLKKALIENLQLLQTMSVPDRLAKRYQKFRQMGIFWEGQLDDHLGSQPEGQHDT